MKICIIGTGYVGLVTGACFAQTGNTVICVDKDENKINLLNDGLIPIYEPGLEEIIKNNVQNHRLHFTTNLAKGINQADVSFIAVGTPQDEDGSADLKHVKDVCEEICSVAKKNVIIATKSTVPVGTGDMIEKLFEERLKYPFIVFSNPEFLKEGDALQDFLKPNRIIVGLNKKDDSIRSIINELYAPFMHQRNRIHFMNRRSAELTKYTANAMLALRITFMNEIAELCDKVDANINDIRQGIGSDPRIGPSFLYPGLGYGGSCFPKDVKALIRMAQDQNIAIQTIEACEQVNHQLPMNFFEKICKVFGSIDHLKGKKIAFWGLSFKAKTDDIRESQALKLMDLLLESGVTIQASDPEALDNVKTLYLDKIHYYEDHMACLDGADALVVATDWNVYRSPDFLEIKKLLKSPRIFDGRNLYDSEHLKEIGFEYVGVGIR